MPVDMVSTPKKLDFKSNFFGGRYFYRIILLSVANDDNCF